MPYVNRRATFFLRLMVVAIFLLTPHSSFW
jgi:hypothetical protein